MESEISRYFKKHLSDWFGKISGSPCKTYLVHQKENNLEIPYWRQYFNLSLEEEVLFTYDRTFWGSHKAGIVITNVAIYCKENKDSPRLVFPWEKISSVEYKENTFFFYYDAYSERPGHIPAWTYFFNLENDANTVYGHNTIGEQLAYHLTCMAKLAGMSLLAKIKDVERNDEKGFDESLSLIQEIQADKSCCQDGAVYYHLGKVLVSKASSLEHIDSYNSLRIEKILKKAIDLAENKAIQKECFYWLASLYARTDQNAIARNYFILAMESDDETTAESAKQMMVFQEEMLSVSGTWDDYVNQIDYKDRKFLMPINDKEIAGCYAPGIETFRMSNIPTCIDFPTGHPIAKELYIGHPYKPSIYVPYSESEEYFFIDKIDELTYLLQCLGAEDITITSIKGRNLSEFSSRNDSFSVHADIETIKVSGAESNSISREQRHESMQQHSLHIKCDPMKYPYVPDGLIWYGEQPRWQRMVEGRLNGNRLEYSEFISSTDTRFVSNTEKQDIKAAAEYIWIKVDGSAEANLETQFKEHLETQWRVDVKFRSLRDFTDEDNAEVGKNPKQLTVNEQEYLDEVKFTLEDGEIGPRERKSLERARIRLGISEERANEIEVAFSAPKLTDEEKEYLDEVKAMLEDGEIGPRERKSLERARIRLGISEERAKEIESL